MSKVLKMMVERASDPVYLKKFSEAVNKDKAELTEEDKEKFKRFNEEFSKRSKEFISEDFRDM